MRILIIEDHALVRDGLAATMSALGPDVATVGVPDFEGALAALDADDFDLVTLDLMLPGTRGQTALPALRRRAPSTPVLVLSALDDVATIHRVMHDGAAGFVSKAAPAESLLEAARAVLAGDIYLSPQHRQGVERVERSDAPANSVAQRYGLTAAQTRVLEVLAEGLSNRQIADVLGLTEGTVKIHVSAILKALSVSSRAEAVLRLSAKRR